MKEFDYAVEYTKTFIGLASILLGLTLTFASSILGANNDLVFVLLVAWLFWIASIYFGARSIGVIVVLVAGAGAEEMADDDKSPEPAHGASTGIFDRDLKNNLRAQRYLFLSGFLFATGTVFYSMLQR